ncbi:MAG: glycerol-3-phosphate dehydrogenase/oxidase [Nannocystis sp.]|uniref:glycerol-3-phosphate dehydrogenase/oxidase n=1 Tax=Nannocystis sp. TaxID=1962667 RepID=UPI002424BF3D|nr:glycerol-3-phosphate dehydrogenase/oxidase [Nannocystis sp.]MBK9757756.1 glycerol-3-phosphate dehydrogenase/oxidase [Nannocystis sp.]
MPATRRNNRADALAEQVAPPAWGPAEIRALADRIRTGADPAPWDLLVVGAGITGAGIARDAAMRGLRVLVVDGRDLAFGTSSRSSRLIHGGVRYLEQGEIGLVYEALRERRRLYKIAGHLVAPVQFLFPAYRGDRLPLWKLRVGLTLYDALSLYRSRGHRTLGPAATRRLEPLLVAEGLRGAVSYEDAVTDDARLTLTTLQSARRHGAEVLTYSPVVALRREGPLHVAELADGVRVQARAVFVAAGPWTSEKLLGASGRQLLSLSRGIHIVLKAADLPLRQPVVVQAAKERRILFVVPWGARTYLGTTDTAYEGDPGASGVTTADADELFRMIGRILPSQGLRHDHIVSAWSGVRPLVRAASAAGGDSTVELSRSHRIVETETGVFALVGGKLTTYRAMAEEAVDKVEAALGLHLPRCSTHRLPLVPGRPLTPAELGMPHMAELAGRHGPFARELAARITREPALGERLIADLPYLWAEVDHAIAAEGCVHIEDILRRRLPLALTDGELGIHVARPIAERLVAAWGRPASAVDEEIERYRELMHRETGRSLGRC